MTCRCWRLVLEPTKQVHHPPRHVLAQPDIAVRNPDYIPFRLSVRTAHVPDLRVRAQVPFVATIFLPQERILVLDEDLCVCLRMGGEKLAKDRQSGIIAGRDAEVYGQFFGGVGLGEGRGEAGAEVGL